MLNFNFDLILVGLTVITIGSLGLVVFLNNKSSITNKTFLLFGFTAIFYSIVNYLSYQFREVELTLWLLRLVLFSSVWYSFFLFQLLYVFPSDKLTFSKYHYFPLLFSIVVISLITLSPATFIEIKTLAPVGEVSNPERGPGAILFGITTLVLVVISFFVLGRKTYKSSGVLKKQLRLVLIGTIVTYALIIVFNMIFPLALNNLKYIPFVPVFTLPFIFFTFYAIVKHHLFNVKLIATQLLTFSLWIFLLIRTLLSQSFTDSLINWGLLTVTVIVGILLIRSVMLEVKRREQLEKMTNLLGEATTKLEGANAQLKQLDQAKSDFISIASHQLRTPLTVIKGYISMMQEGSFGKVPAKINENLAKVFLSNERLINLVEDLLNISRIESGRQQFDWTKFDIVELVGRLTEQLVQNAKAKGLKLSFHPPKEGKIEITAEYNKLHDVIINFIDNAIKYTAEGEINVVMEAAPKGMVTIKVKDTGRGLDEVTKNSLFQKFGRGQGSFQVNAGGTGLGLYVAKMIVEAHEGKIWAESEGVNKGSAFCFSLPIDGPKNKSNMPFAQTGQKVENPVASAPRPSLAIPPTTSKK